MHCILISSVNIGKSAKRENKKSCALLEDIAEKISSLGLGVYEHTYGSTENEPATTLAADLMNSYVWSVRYVVHTLDVSFNDVFTHRQLQKYMDIVNQVSTTFKQHPKANMLQRKRRGTGWREAGSRADFEALCASKVALSFGSNGEVPALHDDIAPVAIKMKICQQTFPTFPKIRKIR